MTAHRFAVAASVVLLCSANAPAAVIGFDDFNAGGGTGFAAADRYGGQGIVFSRTIPIEDLGNVQAPFYPTFVGQGGTLRNAMTLNPGIGVLSLDMIVAVPTDLVTVRVFDTEIGSVLGTLEAFDANGVLLDTATLITPDSQSAVLRVQGSGIARVRFSSDSDGADFDNLYFGTIAEPATWALFALGLCIVSLRRRPAQPVTGRAPWLRARRRLLASVPVDIARGR